MKKEFFLGMLFLLPACGDSAKKPVSQKEVRQIIPSPQPMMPLWQTVLSEVLGAVGVYEKNEEGTTLGLRITNSIPFTDVTLDNFLSELATRLASAEAPFQEVDLHVSGENGMQIVVKMMLSDALAYSKKEISQPELIRRMDIQTIETLESIKAKTKAARETGKLEEAELYLKKWIEREPASILALSLLGNVYRDEKKYWEAMTIYEKLALLNPAAPFSYWNQGYCYERLGALNDAVKMYQKVLEIDPQNVVVRGQLAEVLRKSGATAE